MSTALAEDQSLIPTTYVRLLGTPCDSSSTGTTVHTNTPNTDLHVYTESKTIKSIFKIFTKLLTEINRALLHKPRQILVHLCFLLLRFSPILHRDDLFDDCSVLLPVAVMLCCFVALYVERELGTR